MTDPTVPAESRPSTCGTIAADLRRVADAFDAVSGLELKVPPFVVFDVQPGGTDQQIMARVDAIGHALFGKPGKPQRMGGNTWHYNVSGTVGVVRVDVYDGIADPETPKREAELAALRARVAELESRDPLAYSRPADSDDPQPVAGRVPPHMGAMTGHGLVDETPAEPLASALANSAAGNVTDLGDFTQYADNDPDDDGEGQSFVFGANDHKPLHYDGGGTLLACGMSPNSLPQGHGAVGSRDHVTCEPCKVAVGIAPDCSPACKAMHFEGAPVGRAQGWHDDACPWAAILEAEDQARQAEVRS